MEEAKELAVIDELEQFEDADVGDGEEQEEDDDGEAEINDDFLLILIGKAVLRGKIWVQRKTDMKKRAGAREEWGGRGIQ